MLKTVNTFFKFFIKEEKTLLDLHKKKEIAFKTNRINGFKLGIIVILIQSAIVHNIY